MNREILFKAKRIDNGEWCYFGLFEKYPENAVNPDTICQYVGLCDKNGNKIFEGDRVKSVYYPLGANPKSVEYYKEGIIVYSCKSFGVQLKINGMNVLDKEKSYSWQKDERKIYKHATAGENWVDINLDFNKLEIIGNIHD